MNANDIFIGGMSILLGISCLAAAIHNHDWYFRLRKAHWIESRWGRNPARAAYAVLGAALIGTGIFIIAGRGG